MTLSGYILIFMSKQGKAEMSHEEKLREIAVASGTPVPSGVNGKSTGEQVSPNTQARSKFSSQQGFTPKVQYICCCRFE